VPITEFDKLEDWLRSGCEVVIGSRGLPASIIVRNQRRVRQVGSRAFAFVMHTLIGLHDIVDTQCGFKFFRREAAIDLFARQKVDGYMFDVEILLMAKQAGYRVKEVPIRWRDDHDSRLNLFAGNFRNGLELLSIWWRLGRASSARGAVRGRQAVDALRSRTDATHDEHAEHADPRPN
jgi:dolichyl-phosphate beta-glucosyltransferase